MSHAQAKLARAIDWGFLEKSFGAVYADVPGRPLYLAERVREQRKNQRGRKVYSLHAPEVECALGSSPRAKGQGQGAQAIRVRGKASVATTLHRLAGGQFVAHVKALPGNPYDGHAESF